MRRPLRAALIVAAIAALVTVPGLGNGTLWDNSETAYGEVAREILLSGNWVVMHLNGLAWFVQPPLYFWIAALCAKVLGVTSFALRLPSALATIAMGAVTAYTVTRQAGTRAGIYAGVVLSTCLMQAIVGRLAIMDAMLDLSVAITVFCWFRALQAGRDSYFIYGWIAAALGFLTKGPVAPVIALLVIVPYYFWERRATHAHLPSWRGWLGGIVLFAAIAAPWFAALAQTTGLHSVAELIGHYTFGRYTGTIENQSGPVWYYLPVVILGFFPWIAFFPSALAFGIDRLRARSDESSLGLQQLIRLSFTWMLLPLIFFSFAKTKLPNYIALELPALAVLVALYFDSAVERARSRSALISTAAVPAFILLLAIAIVWFSRDNRLTGDLHNVAINLVYMGGAIFVGSIAAFFTLLGSQKARAATPYVLGVAMVFAVAFLALLALPLAEQFKPVPHLAKVIEAQRKPSDAVAILNVSGGNALLFYTRPHVYVLQGQDDEDRSVICSAPRTWLITHSGGDTPLFGRAPKTVATYGKDSLYLYDRIPCVSAR